VGKRRLPKLSQSDMQGSQDDIDDDGFDDDGGIDAEFCEF
jgi:hypothetical protein